mgnify:CR=1 FL=1
MTLYDHLSMPKEYAVEKPIDKKELLYLLSQTNKMRCFSILLMKPC